MHNFGGDGPAYSRGGSKPLARFVRALCAGAHESMWAQSSPL